MWLYSNESAPIKTDSGQVWPINYNLLVHAMNYNAVYMHLLIIIIFMIVTMIRISFAQENVTINF